MKATYLSAIVGAAAIAAATFGVDAGTANAASLSQFIAPSGNIGCLVGPEGAVCQIRDHSYLSPQRPDTCHGAYGDVLAVQNERARITCHTDAPIDFHSPIVDYGQQVRQGNFVCTVSLQYVQCVNATTGHGFQIAREFYTVY
ncbi:DUF6636 domain-containing protein [Nocardia sp. NPDC052001]|uniref:DUF6636 domain-containing protein n=1 Tax=Nocardia sp. NPDC052001 TaxID=3154853 RepID=UPI00343C50C6